MNFLNLFCIFFSLLLFGCTLTSPNEIPTPKWAVFEKETISQTQIVKDYIIYDSINETIKFYEKNTSFQKVNEKWILKNNTYENEFIINNEKIKISISKNLLCISKTTLVIKRKK